MQENNETLEEYRARTHREQQEKQQALKQKISDRLERKTNGCPTKTKKHYQRPTGNKKKMIKKSKRMNRR